MWWKNCVSKTEKPYRQSCPSCRNALGNTGTGIGATSEHPSDSIPNSQSGSGQQAASATEQQQQQQFVQQMLQALANTNNEVLPYKLFVCLQR